MSIRPGFFIACAIGAAFVFSPIASAADEAATIDPQVILARMKAATGGDQWDSLRTRHVVARLATGGLIGTTQQWDDPGHGTDLRQLQARSSFRCPGLRWQGPVDAGRIRSVAVGDDAGRDRRHGQQCVQDDDGLLVPRASRGLGRVCRAAASERPGGRCAPYVARRRATVRDLGQHPDQLRRPAHRARSLRNAYRELPRLPRGQWRARAIFADLLARRPELRSGRDRAERGFRRSHRRGAVFATNASGARLHLRRRQGERRNTVQDLQRTHLSSGEDPRQRHLPDAVRFRRLEPASALDRARSRPECRRSARWRRDRRKQAGCRHDQGRPHRTGRHRHP